MTDQATSTRPPIDDPSYDRWIENLRSHGTQRPTTDISVIIPVHDIHPDYVNAAIQSIADQTVDDLPVLLDTGTSPHPDTGTVPSVDGGAQAKADSAETDSLNTGRTKVQIVIIDDHSTDPATLGWIKGLGKDADGITLVRLQEDDPSGVAAARNAGLPVATGRRVMYLDSDDVLADDHALEALIKAMRSNPDAKVASGDFHYEFRNGERCVCRPLGPMFSNNDDHSGREDHGNGGQRDVDHNADGSGSVPTVDSESTPAVDQTANNAPTGDNATSTGTGRTDTGKDRQTREIPLGMEFVRTVLTGNLKGDPLPSERGVIWGRLYDRDFLLNGTPLHGWFDPGLRRLSDVVWNVMVMTQLVEGEIVHVPREIVSYKVRGGSITNGQSGRKRQEMQAVVDSLRGKILPSLQATGIPLEPDDALERWVGIFEDHVMQLCDDAGRSVAEQGWFFDRDQTRHPLTRNGSDADREIDVTSLERF